MFGGAAFSLVDICAQSGSDFKRAQYARISNKYHTLLLVPLKRLFSIRHQRSK
jgi:hypothetical protein